MRAGPFPLPPIFGKWEVGEITPEGADASAEQHVYPPGTELQITADYFRCRLPGTTRAWDRGRSIHLAPIEEHERARELAAALGLEPVGFVYEIRVADRSGLSVWTAPDDRAFVLGNDVVQVWRRVVPG